LVKRNAFRFLKGKFGYSHLADLRVFDVDGVELRVPFVPFAEHLPAVVQRGESMVSIVMDSVIPVRVFSASRYFLPSGLVSSSWTVKPWTSTCTVHGLPGKETRSGLVSFPF
jgi:hypothetical protein